MKRTSKTGAEVVVVSAPAAGPMQDRRTKRARTRAAALAKEIRLTA